MRVPTIDKDSPFAVEVAWWFVKSVGLGIVLMCLPVLVFGPPLWWLAAVNHALLQPDAEHVQGLFVATVLCVAWGGVWTVIINRKGVSR